MKKLFKNGLCCTFILFFSIDVWAVDILDAWIKAAPPTATVTAGFMVLKNTSAKDVRLVKVTTKIAQATEMHSMVMVKNAMEMRPVESILIKANSEVHLKPGGLHIMFIDLLVPLKKDENHFVTFHFDDQSEKQMNIRVETIASRSDSSKK